MSEHNLHFKTNVQLKSIIGKDLINDDNIAILELVKNSFDADAKRVDIIYQHLKDNDDASQTSFTKKTSRLFIKDDGLGMDLEDLKNKWLNIAYSEKKSNQRQHNRLMAGAKGVGRFSCDRLGEYLNLYAKRKDIDQYYVLHIDWKKFEIEDEEKEIQSIDLDYEILSVGEVRKRNIPKFNHGVLLEIIKLRSKWVYEIKDSKGQLVGWNTEKLVNLKKYLEKLINPNQAFEKNDFGIYLDAPEFRAENNKKQRHEQFIGKVENAIFEKLDFQSTSIESSIIEAGQYIYTELKDKGDTIFWIKERNDFFPNIKSAKIFLYYLNPYAKAFFTKQTGIRSVDYGSIFLFINGFRVPPYGEVGNDWLGIDQRKAQGFARYIGLREYVGRIEILDYSNDFQIISSREGIVKNENYQALVNQEGNKSYFFRTLRRLEKYVVDGLDWDSIPETDKNRINEIEKKIISGETKQEELVYREDISLKRRRVYESIHSIISARPENVIELYINEDLILSKIEEERRNSEREFDQLLSDIESHKIDADILARVLQKKAEQNKEIEKQLHEFSRFSTNEATTRAITELQYYKEAVIKQTDLIEKLKKQLESSNTENTITKQRIEFYKSQASTALEKAKDEEEKRKLVEKEKEEVVKEKDIQILFHQKLLTHELEQLLEFHHNIGISASAIEGHLINLKDDLSKGRAPSKNELNDLIESISYETNKITSITNLATAANFNADADEIDTDLKEFIKQYIERVKLGKLKSSNGDNMLLKVVEKSHDDFMYHFKPLEIAIVLDNLFSNSRKAKATQITITLDKPTDNSLLIVFRDNGVGIPSNNIEKIFDFGFTTTSGSGLGLHHIRGIIINKYGGELEVAKNSPQGAQFSIKFKK